MGTINASAPMVCSPNNAGSRGGLPMPGYGKPNYATQYGNGAHGAPSYGGAPYNNFGHPPHGYTAQQQPMQYNNGMMPPQGMMIQQPGNMMMQPNGVMPQQQLVMQQQNMLAQATPGSKCTCQKSGTSAGIQGQGAALQAQGMTVTNDNGVIKVYDPSTSVNAAGQTVNASGQVIAKKPGVKVVYDDTHPNDDIILVRPTNMSQDQKNALESQITGIPVASNASFNSALAGMNDFGSTVK